jgi:hypothetical protein
MQLPSAFLAELPQRTNEELYDMLAHADDYLPEALEAARAELGKRNLSPERVANLESVSQQNRSNEQHKADESLGWIVRILMFLSSMTIFLAMLGLAIMPSRYQSRGYTKKAKQCWTCWGVGLAFWVLLWVAVFLVR